MIIYNSIQYITIYVTYKLIIKIECVIQYIINLIIFALKFRYQQIVAFYLTLSKTIILVFSFKDNAKICIQ